MNPKINKLREMVGMDETTYSAIETAEILKIKVGTLYKRVRAGKLECTIINGKKRFNVDQMQKHIRGL